MSLGSLYSSWCPKAIFLCHGVLSACDLMIHPVPSTALISVLCNCPLPSRGLHLLWVFHYFFSNATCVALHEATARMWCLLSCRDIGVLHCWKSSCWWSSWKSSRRAGPFPVVKAFVTLKSRRANHDSPNSFKPLKLLSFMWYFRSELHCERDLQPFTGLGLQHLWVWFFDCRPLTLKQ